MKPKPIVQLLFSLVVLLCANASKAQSFGTFASAVWISDCNQSNFFNTSGSGANLIGPSGNVFDNANLGTHTQNSGTLILRGGEVKTFKTLGVTNVCGVKLYYRIYPQSGAPGGFTAIDLPFLEDCDVPNSQFPSGGPCSAGDQKWQRVIPDGTTVPYSPVNLTSYAPGNYYIEVYYEVTGSNNSSSGCGDILLLNNGGNNYKASFSIQSPTLSSNNPVTCNGTEGSITLGGLTAGSTYAVSYTDDGTPVGPLNLTANGSGQLIISGLNAGLYSNITLTINGCTTNLFTGVVLSNPIFSPSFNAVAPFCAGTTAPVLPTTSNNGITGTWSPATVSNTASATYTFTPTAGQCGIPATLNVTVIPRTTPTFSFGTSLTICNGGSVPALPNSSTNFITGTWSPSTVSNTASGTYTFTPNSGQCANNATFTVTVNPIINPTFSFGTTLTICSGGTVPTLPNSSSNGINGTWSPSTISNTASGTYTFTPTTGQCATTTTFTVTVNPNVTPTFSFGTSLTLCNGGTVPTLVTTSTNSITGTWSPATVSNTASGTYTFTPTAGQCATTTTFTVTVNPNITPTFGFGTSLSICNGGTVPTLVTTSSNSITGMWNPSTVDNTTSGTYTFTPTAGQCATTATFTLTVNPNITPTFGFGTTLSVCSGGTVPTLPTTSSNSITGTWSPSTVSNTASGTYTFTPTAGQCATTTTFTVTVNPNVTPTFSFGTSLTLCNGGTVPTLVTTSTNSITGAIFTVTVNPILTPTFSFGTSLTICQGSTAPALPNTSTNGVNGTWSPATIDNQANGTYTFTPNPGECAVGTSLTVTVTPTITPTFSFGTTLTICSGGTVPVLSTTSSNGVNGTWSPATVSNTASGTYTFTPTATPQQCILPVTYTVTVNPNVTPTFSFGTSQSVCVGSAAPVLVIASSNGINGTWNPSVVDNQNDGVYTFTPNSGQCATTATFTFDVNPIPTVTVRTDTTLNDGGIMPITTLTGSPQGVILNWTNSNPAIGLGASGTGNIPSFIAVNKGETNITATITVTPLIGGCTGTPKTFTITVRPLNKDVFVPNVFSPNNDGKNDKLFVYGNYIQQLEMRIFNQWGEQVAYITNTNTGWDGTQRGKPQPVGVYVYVLKAVLTDGRTVNLKGSITLVR
ncbi:MAG: gliding motility-associated C-terminal domain-containing protein [Sphingobacteriales bacterium]|nr:gliding motility-associated C-terminal domain-containing protein [Sphingobacteriales bacterium]